MKILVTGGTGFIGSHVIDELMRTKDQADEIFCMSRNPARATQRWGDRVSVLAGDVNDVESLDRATKGMDVVIHCVQFPNHPVENRRKGWTYMKVDGEGTARLVEACKKNKVGRFIYLSGAGVSLKKPQPWFQAKAMAEKSIRESGIPYVIFRPSWVYGPEDRSLNTFVSFIHYLPFVPVIGNGKGKVQPVSVFDLAKVVAAAVRNPQATNKTFDVAGPETLSMDEMLKVVQRVIGKRRMLVHQPVTLMKVASLFMALFPTPALSPGAIDFILMEELVDSTETKKVFGIEFVELEDALKSYLR